MSRSNRVVRAALAAVLALSLAPASAFAQEGGRESEAAPISEEEGFCETAVNLANATVSDIPARVYTGKKHLPKVVVRCADKTLRQRVEYRLSYKGNRNVGTATVIVTGINGYEGKIAKKFKINPPKTKLVFTKGAKNGFVVKWAKRTKQVSGYQVRWSTKASFATYSGKAVAGCGKVSATVKGLKSDTTYYVKVRTYKVANGKRYYSGWTSPWKARTKHSHKWVPVTKAKWVVDKQAWIEEVCTGSRWHCSGCGAVFNNVGAQSAHAEDAALSGNYACGGSWVEEVWETVYHDAQGHYETVTVGWKCSCGAMKK